MGNRLESRSKTWTNSRLLISCCFVSFLNGFRRYEMWSRQFVPAGASSVRHCDRWPKLREYTETRCFGPLLLHRNMKCVGMRKTLCRNIRTIAVLAKPELQAVAAALLFSIVSIAIGMSESISQLILHEEAYCIERIIPETWIVPAFRFFSIEWLSVLFLPLHVRSARDADINLNKNVDLHEDRRGHDEREGPLSFENELGTGH